MPFFVISNSDGDTTVDMVSKEQLNERLNEKYWGESAEFFDAMPAEMDTNYWGGKILIINGDVAFPKPVKVVTEWEM